MNKTRPPWWKKAVNFAFLKGLFSGILPNPEAGRQESEPRNRTTEAEITVTDERTLQIPTVFSAIRLIAEIVGILPLHLYRRTPDGGRERVDDHPVAQLLKYPNPVMTGQEYLEATASQIAGWGNSYGLVARANSGKPVELWPLHPSKMCVERKDFAGVDYVYTHNNKTTKYNTGQILHFKGFGDGFIGLSPLGYARQSVGIQIAAERYAASFYRQGGRASSIFMPDKPLTSDQRAKFQEYFQEIGRTEGGGLWVVPTPGKWQDITIPPEDAQMLVTRQFQIGEIARIFRIPLFLLMEMEKSTSWGTGLEQQNLAFLTYTVSPYIRRIENVMTWRLLSPAEQKELYIEFNVDALLRADSKTRAEVQSILLQNGVFNRNEVRAQYNKSGYEGGEVFTAQTNLSPVEKLGEPDPLEEAITNGLQEEEEEAD